jgi:hypothetical protein
MEVLFSLPPDLTGDQTWRVHLLDRVGERALRLPARINLQKGVYVFVLETAGMRLCGLLEVLDTTSEMVRFTTVPVFRDARHDDLISIFRGARSVQLYQTMVGEGAGDQGAGTSPCLARAYLGSRQSVQQVRISDDELRTIELRFAPDYQVELWDWDSMQWTRANGAAHGRQPAA